MGLDKLTMPLLDNGETLLNRSVRVLASVFPTVLYAAKEPLHGLSIEVVLDRSGHSGPVAGVISGLKHVGKPVFMMSGDLPEVTPEAIRFLCNQQTHPNIDRLICGGERGVEPLFGVYFPTILSCLEKRCAKQQFSLQQLPVREQIVSQERVIAETNLSSWGLRSLNTPEDLREYESQRHEILAE